MVTDGNWHRSSAHQASGLGLLRGETRLLWHRHPLRDVEIATDGTRVLGGPVGSSDYCRSFAENLVQEVIEDLDVISRMSSLQAQLPYGGFSSTSG